ncbi:MAG: Rne/Rng family ribonuclease [Alphaproteobacteria bacterium]|nr:Rne/Rng family ribonuclease [Alphaproteobacteria bacterium]
MNEDILVNVGLGETRIAVVRDGVLAELFVERPHRQSPMGAVYLGRVERVMVGMEAAFVDIGLGKAGFLGAWDARPKGYADPEGKRRAPPIAGLVQEGQALLVQATKEPTGDKGARLSTHVSLAGRYVVFLPTGQGVAVSRQITDEAERARLSAMVAVPAEAAGCGYIVRTAALGVAERDLAADIANLASRWQGILADSEQADPPACLHQELAAAERAVRDLVRPTTRRFVVDHGETAKAAKTFAGRHVPAIADAIEWYREGDLFAAFAIEEQWAAALAARVTLPAGGHITIEPTEALTAIDVNSGRYVRGADPAATALVTNLEAAREIARQVSLRNLGGLIVIDFIHMTGSDHGSQVIEALRAGCAADRAVLRVGSVSEFGLVAMTRKRTRESLDRLLTDECFYCEGRRRLPSVETVAYELLRRAERQARARPGGHGDLLLVRAAPEVVELLQGDDRPLLQTLERRLGCTIEIEAHADLLRDEFDFGDE